MTSLHDMTSLTCLFTYAMCYCRKMWIRVVWREKKNTYSDAVPATWVRDNTLFWPPKVSVAHAKRMILNQTLPDYSTWRQYEILAIKLTSDNYEEVARSDLDTASESEPRTHRAAATAPIPWDLLDNEPEIMPATVRKL